jgi:hypothetical protein
MIILWNRGIYKSASSFAQSGRGRSMVVIFTPGSSGGGGSIVPIVTYYRSEGII